MKQLWTHGIEMVSGIALLDDLLVVTGGGRIDALGLDGQPRWRVDLGGALGKPFACGDVVITSSYRRDHGTVVVALDRRGDERWRYERDWSLVSDGLDAGDGDVVLAGTLSRTGENRWVVLAAADGSLRHEVEAPTDGYARIAGAHLVAPVAQGAGGIVRTTRDGRNAMPLSQRGHSTLAVVGETVLLGTWEHDDPPRLVAIDVARAQARWEAPGGANLGIGTAGALASWIEERGEERRAVVGAIASGATAWRSDALLPPSRNGYQLVTDGEVVIVYGDFDVAVTFRRPGTQPIETRPWDRFQADGLFIGERFYELGGGGVACWDLG